jgi:hypothetical protein
MPESAKSAGHVAFVGEYEFLTDAYGDLYWARIDQPIAADGRRAGQFYTSASGADFALRIARLAAGEMARD